MPSPLWLLACLLPWFPLAQPPDQVLTFKVMAWNILHGGRDIENGVDHVIEIIRAIDPDVVLMVETYGSGPRIAKALDYHFHLVAPEGTAPDDPDINLSVFSRFPLGDRIDTAFPFYLGGREILVQGQPVRLLSNWFHYDPWEDEPHRMGRTAEGLLAWEKSGKKWTMLQQVLPVLTQYANEADSIPLIVAGDMNAPSHLDWAPSTRHLHGGLVVPWQVSSKLEALGLIDAYRKIHPDPLSHPGITWDLPDKKDEHRIDFVYFAGEALQAIEAETHQAYLGERLKLGAQAIPFPSDHGLVVTTFELDLAP